MTLAENLTCLYSTVTRKIDFIAAPLLFRMKHQLESSADEEETVERQRFKPDLVSQFSGEQKRLNQELARMSND
jgi:hypothetical protein